MVKKFCKHQIWERLLESILEEPNINVSKLLTKTTVSPVEMNNHLKVLSNNCLVVINPSFPSIKNKPK